jgi:hypothetical protein
MRTPRNAPCPCGRGLKYKHCCGAPAGEQAIRHLHAARVPLYILQHRPRWSGETHLHEGRPGAVRTGYVRRRVAAWVVLGSRDVKARLARARSLLQQHASPGS